MDIWLLRLPTKPQTVQSTAGLCANARQPPHQQAAFGRCRRTRRAAVLLKGTLEK